MIDFETMFKSGSEQEKRSIDRLAKSTLTNQIESNKLESTISRYGFFVSKRMADSSVAPGGSICNRHWTVSIQ
jgi:hypothetical protein